jgi:pimeloyl-ACP methyl ester carboxylesterase
LNYIATLPDGHP